MTKTIPMPPRAEKQPRVETWHGHEKRDDYHWLKAENWQQVMQDPAVLSPKIRAFSRSSRSTCAIHAGRSPQLWSG